MLVIVPAAFPGLMAAGVDSVYLGVVIVLNMMISLATPPVGVVLFIMSNAPDMPLGGIVKEVLHFLVVLVSVLLFFPDLSLWLPRLLGYAG